MSSTTSTSSSKISMFGTKIGFVIPKNKLSGSLVPIFQRSKTLGGGSKDNGMNAKLGKRKTKWGPDLTQDAAVKKGRVLAYQKRLDQITLQLESGTLEVEANRELDLATPNAFEGYQNASDIAQHLESEKREAIGEILELNPRYKAPPDYKPLLKEARLPIPVKENSDLSFLSLIFGSQGDSPKQLEKETGAKVQIFGTKLGGEKVELSPLDENEIKASWQELYFQISSDTYEKVDAAIAVIELLISSVSGNTGAGPALTSMPEDISSNPNNNIPGNNTAPTEASSGQSNDTSVQLFQSQFPQHGSPFPLASTQVPVYPPVNPSAPSLDNRIHEQNIPANSLNPNPLFSQQPLPLPRNIPIHPDSQVPRPSAFPSTSMAYPVIALQGSLTQPGFSGVLPISGKQMQPTGPHAIMRPSAPVTFQTVPDSVFRPRLLPNIDLSNTVQSVHPLPPNVRPHPAHQPGTGLRSVPFPSNIQVNHLPEYASGGSLRPLAVSGPTTVHIAGRPSGPIPTYPSMNIPTNVAPRQLVRDFGFHPQQSNIIRTPHISPRLDSQSVQLLNLVFQAASLSQASQPLGQSFARPQHFGRQMDQQPPNHLPASFHGDPRPSILQNFGPSLPQMMPRNFPGAQFPQQSASFPPRPVFRHDNPMPSGRPQIRRFNAAGHQVYDPFSPSDV